ncbi:MAG: hypothetical protein JJU11_00800, partial [Candidatus Sumerlaeia bacterium]|nr:hypothetical protein [Candidatus Sumerlaeia bacterium]
LKEFPMPSPPPKRRPKYPESQLYLIHGNNETEVGTARFELVHELLTPEERDSGLTEIMGPGNQPLKLDRALSEIIEELGTSSFIAGSRRVAVIYDLQEMFGSGGGKKKAPAKKPKKKSSPAGRDRMEILTEWLRDVLPTTENIAIFVCNENDEKRKKISPTTPIFNLIRDKGAVIERSEKPLNFEFENHLLAGNPTAAITLLREWLKRAGSDSSSRLRIYSTLSGAIQVTLEARLVQLAKERGIPETQVLAENVYPRLSAIPSFKSKKFHELARRLPLETLHDLVEKTNKLQRLLYPSGDEDYIAGWEELAEIVIIQLCTGTRASPVAIP